MPSKARMKMNHLYILSAILPSILATNNFDEFDFDSFEVTSNGSLYDDDSCAYFSSHVTGSPLNKCMSYSYQRTKYSWSYACNGDEIMFQYYTEDTECSETNLQGTTPISSGEGGFAQCDGSGDNCHTVDINIKGFTNTVYDTCDDENDFATFSFVVDECIPSVVEGQLFSSKLSCDSEKLWFEYYDGCTDCTCDNMESYTYEYYNDFDGCWDVKCGVHDQSGIGTPADKPEHIHKGRCEDVKKNDHEGKQRLKSLLTGPLDLNKASFFGAKTKEFEANVMNAHSLERGYDEVVMNWIYVAAGGVSMVLLAGAWQCIKKKEYSMI